MARRETHAVARGLLRGFALDWIHSAIRYRRAVEASR